MKPTANQILIPMDFSHQALIALDQSYNLAKFYNAEITLLHVVKEGGGISKLFSGASGDAATKSEIEDKLHKLAQDIEKQKGIKINTLVAQGQPHEVVLEAANALKAKMIIMGTRHISGAIKKLLGGSVAFRVIRAAKCPVVTIRGKSHRNGCGSIVLPIDLTKETREKVNMAIELGTLYGATIRLVSVLFSEDEFIVNRLTRQMEQVKLHIQKSDVKCTTEIVKTMDDKKPLWQAVIDYATKIEADLIMIMSQQEEGELIPIMSNNAQNLINHSDIPVMSIRVIGE